MTQSSAATPDMDLSVTLLEPSEFSEDDLKGLKLSAFDAADYLDTPELIALYLTAALDSGDLEHFKNALATAERARARHLNPPSSGAGAAGEPVSIPPQHEEAPLLSSVMRQIDALGLSMKIVPKARVDIQPPKDG